MVPAKTRSPAPTHSHRTRERATGLLVLVLIIVASTWLAVRVHRATADIPPAARAGASD